jgi:RNA polymerase sigma-70 factor (ECF subfamily)
LDISSPDSQLIERSLAGESGAFTDLCERHRERIWRIVASVASGPDADDLVQEAVIRAYLSLKSYRRTAPFAAWLSKIALNAAHDYQRSAWKRRVLLLERPPEEEAAECPSAEVQRRETLRRVRDAVSRLPRNMGTPIWLHYFEEFSIAEIAELERTSESTVRARIKSGLSRLLVVLQEHVGVVSDPVRRALETKECKI